MSRIIHAKRNSETVCYYVCTYMYMYINIIHIVTRTSSNECAVSTLFRLLYAAEGLWIYWLRLMTMMSIFKLNDERVNN